MVETKLINWVLDENKESKVKRVVKQSNKKAAFTIIELLTVMSVIILLMGLLVPALNMVKRFAKKVTQKNQFHGIEVAMETYIAEWEEYPPSNYTGPPAYCGAMKLCEAMVGQDLLGFHPNAKFIWDDDVYDDPCQADLSGRRTYLRPGSASAYKLGDLYPDTRPFSPECLVLSDVYPHVTHRGTGKVVGMPILYYRANTSNTGHSREEALVGKSIYNYHDNRTLIMLGKPWEGLPNPADEGTAHAFFLDPDLFYERTWNKEITTMVRPHRADSYILLSAGFDGEYGTDDDIYNFGY